MGCLHMIINMCMALVVVMSLVINLVPQADAIAVSEIRRIAVANNVTGLFVFGDSSVDPGNNNRLKTDDKSNFPPYGIDFFSGRATGRFSNGRLATDFIAEALGYTKEIRPFLEQGVVMPFDLSHGVSFASSGSGYDNLTAQVSSLSVWFITVSAAIERKQNPNAQEQILSIKNVLSLSHQLKHFAHYKRNLRMRVGSKKADESIQNAVFILSMGTNDFLQNYYVELPRRAQFTVDQYGDYLISLFHDYVKKMHALGARRLVMVGVVPFGCMPLVKTLKGATKCDDEYNKVAISFDLKLQNALLTIQRTLGMKTAYVDTYGLVQSAIENPKKYGFEDTTKGCCGTGTIEYGITCKGLDACVDRDKFLFWDAVHPTERMYKIVADEALNSILTKLF
ncbi:GDSL esterase/lipase At5g45950 isoform X1 [Helianthus annuus]|uniref:GDSL esterase/lipase At5g45950 isoform X1 n=1 Tax=Helianthus annuus TaxID=4232 RepID=UPI001652DEF4|nr:GDSL esterase/lipase At5g45950 isoform X1 [Helianthus annuus]